MAVWYKEGLHQVLQQNYIDDWDTEQYIKHINCYLDRNPAVLPTTRSVPWFGLFGKWFFVKKHDFALKLGRLADWINQL